ncbi:hypothetical protein [Synechococcus sp. UW179A]|uniref:hypothetical protein n=1 Tax=Synechococcus sp. UW179A TaxID=2575510 RepID=UPI000E0F661C|nr:hypothetical protein [Synechococcus sp. UW179A]
MKSTRITQLLLAALVVTQVPNLISFIQALSRYESSESALRACNRWAESAGRYSVRRAGLWTSYSQDPVRSCKKEGDQFVGYELPMQDAVEVSGNPGDPKGFNAGEVPKVEDTGKRWRYRRKRWSLVIPF